MSDHDLPPEFRRRNSRPEVLSIEVPLEEELPPPLLIPERTADQQRSPEPFLRQS